MSDKAPWWKGVCFIKSIRALTGTPQATALATLQALQRIWSTSPGWVLMLDLPHIYAFAKTSFIESFWSFTKRRLVKFNGVSKNFYKHLKECEWDRTNSLT